MQTAPIAYLSSEYPAISQTFIFREVESLRRHGFTVKTASIRAPGNVDIMTAEEQADAKSTLCIKDCGIARLAAAHAALKLTAFFAYMRMFSYALSLWTNGPVPLIKAMAYFAEAGVLVHWMRREGIRHVHVHFANPAATVALIGASSGLIEFSLSVHGPDEFYNINQDLIPEKVRKAVFARCISFYCRSQLERVTEYKDWDKFHIVRCGIDVSKYAVRPEPSNAVAEILCVGRLVPAKGQHLLVRACHALKERGVAFHATLVGAGPDRESIEALAKSLGIADCVAFAGPVGQGDIHSYYDKADIFALPSFAEGLPVVLMEAMGKGIPCVTTAITGIPELVIDGVNGLLAPASDWEALADRLQRLIEDPALRKKLSAAAREIVERDYDVQRNCEGMAEVFRRHLAGKQERVDFGVR
ncbi:MAG: glycosyltransferase family 4 protein [Candidatus Hydrogenedentes bacterium]|nr:glycosyltransferase family 4 protein [Candidatus Hydrogenedentota bacterium]